VLHWATATALADLQLYYAFYGRREPHVQRFENVWAYQAESWRQPRRIVAKVEITPQGSQRRYLVTNLDRPADEVYRDFYAQRGAVPEQPIGELKNGLQADRLSACGFCANSWRLLVHVVAYAIVVLFREANAAVPEVATAQVHTLRQRLWKGGGGSVRGGAVHHVPYVCDVAGTGVVGSGAGSGGIVREPRAWEGDGATSCLRLRAQMNTIHFRKRLQGPQGRRCAPSGVLAAAGDAPAVRTARAAEESRPQ